MSLIELLGDKVMLFTCETVAFNRKVSTINLDVDNVSQESSWSTEYSSPDKKIQAPSLCENIISFQVYQMYYLPYVVARNMYLKEECRTLQWADTSLSVTLLV